MHTHPQIQTRTYTTHQCWGSKTDFSHSAMTSAPRLHRLQFADLIGPTNWPSAHLMLTRNWPNNRFLRPLTIWSSGLAWSPQIDQYLCLIIPANASPGFVNRTATEKQSTKPWYYMKLCLTLYSVLTQSYTVKTSGGNCILCIVSTLTYRIQTVSALVRFAYQTLHARLHISDNLRQTLHNYLVWKVPRLFQSIYHYGWSVLSLTWLAAWKY